MVEQKIVVNLRLLTTRMLKQVKNLISILILFMFHMKESQNTKKKKKAEYKYFASVPEVVLHYK